MKRIMCLAAGIVVALAGRSELLTAQDKKTDAKFDAAKLVGKWRYESGVKDGAKVDVDKLKEDVIEITKEKITIKGKETFVFKYGLDTTKKPVGIKLEILESPFGPGAKSAGVIEVAGDTIRLCYAAMDDAKTPSAFESKEGSKAHLFVLKRAK